MQNHFSDNRFSPGWFTASWIAGLLLNQVVMRMTNAPFGWIFFFMILSFVLVFFPLVTIQRLINTRSEAMMPFALGEVITVVIGILYTSLMLLLIVGHNSFTSVSAATSTRTQSVANVNAPSIGTYYVGGQSKSEPSAQQTHTPTPLLELPSAPLWQKFSPPSDSFSIMFPGRPTYSKVNLAEPGMPSSADFYSAQEGAEQFFASVMDYKGLDTSNPDGVLTNAVNGLSDEIPGGVVKSTTFSDYGSYCNVLICDRKITFLIDSSKGELLGQGILDGSSLYMIGASGTNITSNTDRFFGSFQPGSFQ